MTIDDTITEPTNAILEHRRLRRGCGFDRRTEGRIRTQLHRELSVALQTLAHMGYRRIPERASPHYANQQFAPRVGVDQQRGPLADEPGGDSFAERAYFGEL